VDGGGGVGDGDGVEAPMLLNNEKLLNCANNSILITNIINNINNINNI
jgi:hypothetical protein